MNRTEGMSERGLSETELKVIGECLRAVVEGPFIPECEFDLVIGLEREELAEIAKAWPNVDESDNETKMAINNAMNNLIGYPHRREDAWDEYMSVSVAELYRIFKKWRGDGPSSYFDGMI